MIKKTSSIIFLILASAVFYWLYSWFITPEGVTPQSDSSETIAWLGLGASIISLLTAIIGLVQRLVEVKTSED